MLTEETHSAGVADDKVLQHEDAAHEKRNWVRLTFDCNNRCIFCLDSNTHDGEMRSRDEVKAQILDGRKKGATRLILSGGEPTIHPNYVDFVRLGARAGYHKIQTVTNGRLFSYPGFLARCLDAGLTELTFSLHGPNAKIHDALVGVKGAYEQEIAGLRAALDDGRPVVNVDVVINRGNVRQLAEMLRVFTDMGVREFDLLQVVPFGRAFEEGRDTLFYDLEEMRPYLLEAFEYSKRPDLHIWLNRFPPQHLEGYEKLIQDPYKLNDEVRGRKEEFARLLDEGVALDCRDPARCKYCYLEQLCDTLETVRDTTARADFRVLRVDTEWEASQPPVFGGDPASARRAKAEAASRADGKRALPILNAPVSGAAVVVRTPAELVAASGADTLSVRAPDLSRALVAAAQLPGMKRLELELGTYEGIAAALSSGGALAHKTLARAVVATARDAQTLLAIGGAFELVIELNRDTAAWLLTLPSAPARAVLRQPTYERLTESAERDVDLRAFFAQLPYALPIEAIPQCVTGQPERARPRTLDTAMMTPDGRLEIFRFAKRYILEGYRTHSLRCKPCVHRAQCSGLHINFVRAHGYEVMQPVLAAGGVTAADVAAE